MLMNLKEGDCYVINQGENLTVVDFDDNVSLAEKMQAWQEEEVQHGASTAEWMEQKLSGCDGKWGDGSSWEWLLQWRNQLGATGTDGGKSHKKQRMQWQGRKKRQQPGNKLETIAAVAYGTTRRGRNGWPEIRSVSSNYTDGPARRKGKSRRSVDHGKKPQEVEDAATEVRDGEGYNRG
ncbi:hypothetical protein B296_00037989 [Ensete ventricosum]|uniref:Uncharacterized protein n=1 Tax=Ensete ventricosum TaxID=4639 RepID=A0A426Y399_ENSVE|nr:hypothetical protein B296_00037989 [Ensete ventricosum]